jgi:hypothetical protein
MRYRRLALIVVAISLMTLAVYWWVRVRRIPTLRFTFILGKGATLDIVWLDLKPGPD